MQAGSSCEAHSRHWVPSETGYQPDFGPSGLQHLLSRSSGCARHNRTCTQSHFHSTYPLRPRRCHRNTWNQLHTRTHHRTCFCTSYASLTLWPILWPCTQYPSTLGTTHSEDRPCSTCCPGRNMRFHSNHHLNHRMESSPRGCSCSIHRFHSCRRRRSIFHTRRKETRLHTDSCTCCSHSSPPTRESARAPSQLPPSRRNFAAESFPRRCSHHQDHRCDFLPKLQPPMRLPRPG